MDEQDTGAPMVLIIDDDAAMQRLVGLALRTAGFRTCTAVDGQDSLHQLERCDPDATILDIEMPVMDGGTFLHTIRHRGYETPVLVLSGQDAHVAERLPANAHLAKPFVPDELVSKVHRLVAA